MSGTTTFGLTELSAHCAQLDDAGLAALLRARPDLLNPAPADMTSLAARAQSEMSLRHLVQHLDAGTLHLLQALNREEPDSAQAAPEAAAALERAGVLLEVAGEPALPANLPHVLENVPAGPPAPPRPGAKPVMSALVENASLAAISELLSEVEDLLTTLEESPAATLRTGGVGMRELKRITSARSGASSPKDPEVGETGWLVELSAAAGLIEPDADSGHWAPTRLAAQWHRAGRHHRLQLLVSGWLLAPRSPLLLRGPHPSARLAPVLTPERQRGDAPALRDRLLRTAEALTGPKPAELYTLDWPDDAEPGPETFSGPLLEQLAWDRPLLTARTRHVLLPMVREAERLGLLAMGALSAAGRAVVEDADLLAAGEPPSSLSSHLEAALPPLVETVHLQSDLTAVATGTLSPGTAQALGQLAAKETRGGVPTYRFSAETLRGALERGWSPEGIREFLTQHSISEMPSPLSTLIDDAVRTTPSVRMGSAGAWIVEPDPQLRAALLAQPELSSLGLQHLSGEVLVCEASAEQLRSALRRAGVRTSHPDGAPAPAAQTTASAPPASTGAAANSAVRMTAADSPGSSPAAAAAWQLTASPWQQSPVRTVTPQMLARNPEVIDRALTALRSGGTGTKVSELGNDSALAGADVVGTLREAIRRRRTVRITRAGSGGTEHTAVGVPTAMNAGRLRLRHEDREEESLLLIHRITAVTEKEPSSA